MNKGRNIFDYVEKKKLQVNLDESTHRIIGQIEAQSLVSSKSLGLLRPNHRGQRKIKQKNRGNILNLTSSGKVCIVGLANSEI